MALKFGFSPDFPAPAHPAASLRWVDRYYALPMRVFSAQVARLSGEVGSRLCEVKIGQPA
jgi:hypothetical protein